MIILFTIGHIFDSIFFDRVVLLLPLIYVIGKVLAFVIPILQKKKIESQIAVIDKELEPQRQHIKIETANISNNQDNILRKIAKLKNELDLL